MIPANVIILAAAMSISAIGGGWLAKLYYTAEISQIRQAQAEAVSEAERANRAAELAQLDRDGAISERDAARNQKRNVIYRTITKEIIKYVQNPDIEHCDLPTEWVRLHDIAAGRVPEDADPASATDGPAPGITDIDAITVVTQNYGICAETRDRLIALQEWAGSLRESR